MGFLGKEKIIIAIVDIAALQKSSSEFQLS